MGKEFGLIGAMKMNVEVEIQMYMADSFKAIVNREKFEKCLRNCELGYETLVRIRDTKNKEIMFNPKYVAYIKYLDVLEVTNDD